MLLHKYCGSSSKYNALFLSRITAVAPAGIATVFAISIDLVGESVGPPSALCIIKSIVAELLPSSLATNKVLIFITLLLFAGFCNYFSRISIC